MKLKVEGDRFYMVQAGDEKWIHSERDDAIETLKTIVRKSETVPGDASVVEVDVSEDKWSLREVPWSQIALELMKKGGE